MLSTQQTLKQQALADALQSARMHLAEEIAAAVLCEERGWTFDGRVARLEVARYRELITRIEARIAASEV